VLAATQGTDPEAAFQQLRARARASSRKLAELAHEVVQDAQRQRLAALALDDARVREAEARAQAAEQALETAQADLASRRRMASQAIASWPACLREMWPCSNSHRTESASVTWRSRGTTPSSVRVRVSSHRAAYRMK
jgi:regulator of protease activity HflC (stomatin/prohibitin superfamily)